MSVRAGAGAPLGGAGWGRGEEKAPPLPRTGEAGPAGGPGPGTPTGAWGLAQGRGSSAGWGWGAAGAALGLGGARGSREEEALCWGRGGALLEGVGPRLETCRGATHPPARLEGLAGRSASFCGDSVRCLPHPRPELRARPEHERLGGLSEGVSHPEGDRVSPGDRNCPSCRSPRDGATPRPEGAGTSPRHATQDRVLHGIPFFLWVGGWLGCFLCGCILERGGEGLEERGRERTCCVLKAMEKGPEELENSSCRTGESSGYLVIVGEGTVSRLEERTGVFLTGNHM